MIDKIILEDLERIENRMLNFREYFCNKNILVTGGAGFLGSWICDVLIKFGSRVTCQDNFSSGLRSNIDHLLKNERFVLLEKDISDYVINDKFDLIIHMASKAAPEDYNLHQIETLVTNSHGTRNVLEIAKDNHADCVFTSTSEIYGDAKIIPTSEDYWGNVNSVGERSCYDEGKRFGEALCMAYKREHDLNIKIIRIFNTYGPRIRPDGTYGRALSRFILNAINDEPIQIYGDGLQTRSFCYVTDTISGILMYAAKNTEHKILNLGNENEITINDLATKILKNTNSRSLIIHKEKMPDDPKRRKPNISRAKNEINWEPHISLDDGIKRMVEWIKQNKHIYKKI